MRVPRAVVMALGASALLGATCVTAQAQQGFYRGYQAAVGPQTQGGPGYQPQYGYPAYQPQPAYPTYQYVVPYVPNVYDRPMNSFKRAIMMARPRPQPQGLQPRATPPLRLRMEWERRRREQQRGGGPDVGDVLEGIGTVAGIVAAFL